MTVYENLSRFHRYLSFVLILLLTAIIIRYGLMEASDSTVNDVHAVSRTILIFLLAVLMTVWMGINFLGDKDDFSLNQRLKFSLFMALYCAVCSLFVGIFAFWMTSLWIPPHFCSHTEWTGTGISGEESGWYQRRRIVDLVQTRFLVNNRLICVDPIENAFIFTLLLIGLLLSQEVIFLLDACEIYKKIKSATDRNMDSPPAYSSLNFNTAPIPPPAYDDVQFRTT